MVAQVGSKRVDHHLREISAIPNLLDYRSFAGIKAKLHGRRNSAEGERLHL